MAQRMLDEKIRVTEDPPEPENAVPFPTDARFVGASPVAEDLEVSESDGETLGSRDTEEDLSTISEEEEEDLEEMEKENIPPRPSSLPLDGTRNRKRRSASSPGKELKRPPIRKRAKSDKDAETAPASKKRRPRAAPATASDTLPPPLPPKKRPKNTPRTDSSFELVPPEVADLKANILDVLVEIENIAKNDPSRRVSIRNRTRESITRQLHYVKDEQKLTKLYADAEKILHLWKSLS
ncbi:33K [Fowl adenovirus 8b]|nr:33K [Fowl adenovirus 8b]